ncbi:MAG: hypothetical protein ACOY90_03255 [Candidatus Zhuqueibacterota bacterium]
MEPNQARTPWILWPFKIFADLLTAIFTMTGRLVACIIGLVLTIIGAILIFTVIAAPVGIPLVLLGVLLLVRSIF